MDVFFTPQPSLPSNLQKRLQAVYPKIQVMRNNCKFCFNLLTFLLSFIELICVQYINDDSKMTVNFQTVAFGINPENHLRQFFPQFFSRLTANNKLIQQEVSKISTIGPIFYSKTSTIGTIFYLLIFVLFLFVFKFANRT